MKGPPFLFAECLKPKTNRMKVFLMCNKGFYIFSLLLSVIRMFFKNTVAVDFSKTPVVRITR